MELKLGIMSSKELAKWFDIAENTFKKNKEKKLKELVAYADFELVGEKYKKVKIIKIYEPIYHKRGS